MEPTIEQLQKKLSGATAGCTIQHKDFPCNACFHGLELTLKKDIHEYWLAVLAFRGDYKDEQERPELIKELYVALGDKNERS